MRYFLWPPVVTARKLAGAICCWLLVAAVVRADETAVEMERLMTGLRSGVFAERQQAMRELQQAGPEALPFVLSGIRSADSELRRRSWSVLEASSLSRRPAMREAARNVVQNLYEEREGTHAAAVVGGVERIRAAI